MEEQVTSQVQEKPASSKESGLLNFFKKWGWLLAVGFGIAAIAFMFAPMIHYEIREAVYDAAGERVFKEDFVYSMHLYDYFSNSFPLNWTSIVTLAFLLLGVSFAIVSRFHKDFSIAAALAFLLSICFLLLAKEFFQAEENAVMDHALIAPIDHVIAEGEYQDNSLHGVSLAWGSALSITFSALAFAAATNHSFTEDTFNVRDIAEDAVLIAMAFGLNFLKIPVGATGGSVNFQMLPLMVIAIRKGPVHGFLCGGIIYGLLTCLTDGYGFACYPFDYLIGFGSVAVLGFFRNLILPKDANGYNVKSMLFLLLGGVLSTFVRFAGSNISSMVVYGYTLKAALAYNSFYIPLSGAISFGMLIALYGPLVKLNQRFNVSRH